MEKKDELSSPTLYMINDMFCLGCKFSVRVLPISIFTVRVLLFITRSLKLGLVSLRTTLLSPRGPLVSPQLTNVFAPYVPRFAQTIENPTFNPALHCKNHLIIHFQNLQILQNSQLKWKKAAYSDFLTSFIKIIVIGCSSSSFCAPGFFKNSLHRGICFVR